MFNYLKPNNLLKIINKTQKFVFITFLVIISIGLVEALILSPEDYKQSDSVRIMYVHVPAAWISLGIFSLIAVLSFGILVFKNKNLSLITKSLAPSGFVFNLIALVAGTIWGKPTWGTWWAWDARITSMLILCLFYFIYIVAWRIYQDTEKVNKVTSFIALIGAVNLPIVKYSVDWWSTLHQPASVSVFEKTSIHLSLIHISEPTRPY